MKIIHFVIAISIALGLNVAFWLWQGKPVSMPDVAKGRMDCLSYTPHTEDAADPRVEDYDVENTVIGKDMRQLAQLTECVRVYTALAPAGDVVYAAKRNGLKVLLGAWLSMDKEISQQEIAEALRLANKYPETVRALVVGNEVLLRREMTAEELIAQIRYVKARTAVPVAYAEVTDFWYANQQVANEVDLVLLHLLPYWGDPAPSIEQAHEQMEHELDQFLKDFAGHKVMIGETGWPSAGPTRQRAVASVINQARFIREFVKTADDYGVAYNIIEALDQPWKRSSEGTAGGFWGILDEHRVAKFPLSGPVSEWPQWRVALLVASSIGFSCSLFALFGPTAWWRMISVSITAHALGTLLVLQARYVHDMGYLLLQDVLGVGAMLLTVLAGFTVMDLLARGDKSRFAVTPAPLAALFGWCRQPSRAGFSPALWLAFLQFTAAFPVAAHALAMAVEARHRDIPGLLLVFPALLSILIWWRSRPRESDAPRREEAWLAIVLLSSGGFCLDGFYNREAIAFTATVLLLALPWIDYLRSETAGWVKLSR